MELRSHRENINMAMVIVIMMLMGAFSETLVSTMHGLAQSILSCMKRIRNTDLSSVT